MTKVELLQQVQALLEREEITYAGYGSSFVFKPVDEGIRVVFKPEWDCLNVDFVVTAVDGDRLTLLRSTQDDGEAETLGLAELRAWLEEYGQY